MAEYFANIYNGVKTFLTGMKMTLKHFNNKEDLVATLQYPHEKWPIPERNIGFEHKDYNLIRSRLHVDIDDCIGCLQCEKVCPVDCIKIDTIKPPKGSDIKFDYTTNNTEKKMLVTRFSIDMAECMYCNLCEYPCPEDCIYMVGGPNESKHEIDYEFSKYEREGLVYEFAFPTDDEILEVGGETYLEKRNSKINKLEEGNLLQGLVEAEIEAKKEDVSAPDSSNDDSVKEEVGLTLKIFNDVPDKVARGTAKKAFQYTKRMNMNYSEMADYINKAINDASKASDSMTIAINNIRDYKDEVILDPLTKDEIDTDLVEKKEEQLEELNIFDIKSLNVISDKMTRGIAKKAFSAAKREGLDGVGKVKYIMDALVENDKMDDSIQELLDSFLPNKLNNSEDDKVVEEVVVDTQGKVLFDIKALNGINNTVARGTSKKIYMAGKRSSATSQEVIGQISHRLKKDGLLTDDISELLNGLSDA